MVIKIRVLRLNREKIQELYRNEVNVTDGLKFDFQSMYDTLKVLYAKSDIIEFSCL